MNNTFNITSGTVTVAEKIDVINQTINSSTQQPSLEELLAKDQLF